jgi:auxin influx carrier (AUX1 LAX family)
MGGQMKRLLWHGGSVYDAWFSAASNQVRARFIHFLHL